jgi:hypothetical protein
MSIDVTNTQTGGEPINTTPDDFKLKLKPIQTVDNPVEQPIIEKPADNPVVPTTTEEPQVPQEPQQEAQPVSFDDVSLPEPIDLDSIDAIDFSAMNQYSGEELIPDTPETPTEDVIIPTEASQPTEELEDPLNVFNELNIIPVSDEESEPSNLFIPNVTSKDTLIEQTKPLAEAETLTNLNQTIEEPIQTELKSEPIREFGEKLFPDGTFTGILENNMPNGTGVLTSNDGTQVASEFNNGTAEGNSLITYKDGSTYAGGVKNNQPNGVGTYTTKDGKKSYGVFKDGNLVAPMQDKGNSNPEQKNAETIESVFKPNDYSNAYNVTETKSETPVDIVKSIEETNDVFVDMQKISHEKLSQIMATNGIGVVDKKKEIEKSEWTSTVKSLDAIVTKEVKAAVSRGEHLTPEQKVEIEKVLEKYNITGEYSNLHKKPTKEVIKMVYKMTKMGHEKIDELNKPVAQPKTVGEEIEANIRRNAQSLKQQLKPGTNQEYGNEVKATIDFVSSKSYSEFVKKELTTGDKIVDDYNLNKKLDKAYKEWLSENKASEGAISRTAFDRTIGDKIKQLNIQVIENQRAKTLKNQNNFGFKKQQEIIDNDSRKLEEKKSKLTAEVQNLISPYYIEKKQKTEKEIQLKYESELSNIKKTADESYRSGLELLKRKNEDINNIYGDYLTRIQESSNKEERATLKDELTERLNSFPEFKELNETYSKYLTLETEKLNSVTNRTLIDLCANIQNEYKKDFAKQHREGIKKLERSSGYLAQFNVYNKTDEIADSDLYKKASYQDKKTIVEQGWNQHVKDVTAYYRNKEIKQPANEDERLNKHFTEWTGKARPKTAEDIAIYSSLISKTAHDKFRVYANYNELNDSKPNTFQYKAMLEDGLAEVEANLEYLNRTLGKDAYHDKNYDKWKQQKLMIQDAINSPEHESNSISAFFSGLADGDIPFIGSILRTHQANNLIDAAERYANGTANRADAGLLLTKNIKETINQLSPTSFTHDVATGVSNTLSFMIEMAATGGVGEIGFSGTKALLQSATKMVGNVTSKTAIISALENPQTVSRVKQLANLLINSTSQAGKVALMTTALPTTTASQSERQLEKVSPQFALVHAGGIDDAIAEIDKGDESWFESTIKSFGISATGVAAELVGGSKIMASIDNAIQKPIVDYLKSNQFLKRTMLGNYMRTKGFTNAEQLSNHISKIMAAGKVTEFHHELIENYIETAGTNIIEGDDVLKGFDDPNMVVSTLITSAFLAGGKGALNLRVNKNNIATNIAYESHDGESVATSMTTGVWNKFNSLVSKPSFDSQSFVAFINDNKLTLPQQEALAHVYVKVNPHAIKSSDAIKQYVSDLSNNEDIKSEDISDGEVVESSQDFTPIPDVISEEIELDTTLTSREREELESNKEQTKTEANDNQNEQGIPSEVGAIEEPIQAEPIQETGSQEIASSGVLEAPTQEVNESNVTIDGDDLLLHHGSPHDFDEFQLEKIGTGEGAQAFGYGLYFTDGSKIAKSYASKLSKDKTGIVYNVRIKGGRTANWADWRTPLDESQESDLYSAMTDEEHKQYENHLDKAFGVTENHDPSYEKDYHGSFGDLKPDKYGFVSYEKQSAAGNIYQDLKDALGQEKATEIFKRANIDGIKYRAKKGYGEETNYVVFNPESISIEKKTNESTTTTDTTTNGDLQPTPESSTKTPTEEVSSIQQGADLLESLSEGDRDDLIDKWLNDEVSRDAIPGGIDAVLYYEAKQLASKNATKPKRVTMENAFELSNHYGFILNVDGEVYGLNKSEDPDATSDAEDKYGDPKEYVWTYTNLKTGESTDSYSNDHKEVINEIRSNKQQNESTTTTDTTTDGGLQSTTKSSTETTTGEALQSTTESKESERDVEVEPNVKIKEKTKKLSTKEKTKQIKEEKTRETLEKLPVEDRTEGNPFHDLSVAGKNTQKNKKVSKQYKQEMNDINEINDNFDNILKQLNLPTKDC